MNVSPEDAQEEWLFRFGLCATRPDGVVTRQQAEELLSLITSWAEKNDFGVGGGFRPFRPEDLEPFPIDTTESEQTSEEAV